jgi:hypothetical protein
MKLVEIHGNRWINPEQVIAVYLSRHRHYDPDTRKSTLIPCVCIETTGYEEQDGEGGAKVFDRLISAQEDPREALREVVEVLT